MEENIFVSGYDDEFKDPDNLYMDVHILQNMPPNCINRDDMGSPKTAVYGGVTRARVSSQAWKHEIRKSFNEQVKNAGYRTKRAAEIVARKIKEIAPDADAEKLAANVMDAAGLTVKNNKGKMETSAMFFISEAQADALAHIALELPVPEPEKKEKAGKEKEKFSKEDKEKCKNALREHPSFDQALFGRMSADDPSLNYDSATQVAHAISTHEIKNEYDYYTAVDDDPDSDNAGAGHLGTTEYNASTLYRYAAVNIRELQEHLKGSTPAVVRAFVKDFIYSMPTGKISSFGNRSIPYFIYVTIRRDQPVNMAEAFENPIVSNKLGFAKPSLETFVDYVNGLYREIDLPVASYVTSRREESLAEQFSISEMLKKLERDVFELCQETNGEDKQ